MEYKFFSHFFQKEEIKEAVLWKFSTDQITQTNGLEMRRTILTLELMQTGRKNKTNQKTIKLLKWKMIMMVGML